MLVGRKATTISSTVTEEPCIDLMQYSIVGLKLFPSSLKPRLALSPGPKESLDFGGLLPQANSIQLLCFLDGGCVYQN